MGLDLDGLREAVARHGRVTRVVIADLRGSSPREVGAAMLIWAEGNGFGQSGTIGGGALEFAAAQAARMQGTARVLDRHALGPDLGQCCGGAVSLLSEVYDAEAVAMLDGEMIARPVRGSDEMPMSVRRLLAQARAQGMRAEAQLIEGWMVEPVHRAARHVWVWGAGHVGRAVVAALAPLPEIAITWVDTGPERFPDAVPEGVTVLPAINPANLVAHAPAGAEHLILTYSHALDLALCHRLLGHGAAAVGLIGSATKWARFRSRLGALGHTPDTVARITCPIGDPRLGKHPQAIALGVARDMLRDTITTSDTKEQRA
jgi:xanthine dehydrogenase accessory factor